MYSRMILERSDAEGEIPVDEMQYIPKWHQSSTGHVKPGMKQGGPPPKAKYYPVTDSEQYREGKVKGPREGSETEPETLCLQAVGAQ